MFYYFQVVDLACGYGFTVFAVKDKSGPSCYGTGLNTDSQIGKNAWNKLYLCDCLLPMNATRVIFLFSSFFHSSHTTLVNPPASQHAVLYTLSFKKVSYHLCPIFVSDIFISFIQSFSKFQFIFSYLFFLFFLSNLTHYSLSQHLYHCILLSTHPFFLAIHMENMQIFFLPVFVTCCPHFAAVCECRQLNSLGEVFRKGFWYYM